VTLYVTKRSIKLKDEEAEIEMTGSQENEDALGTNLHFQYDGNRGR